MELVAQRSQRLLPDRLPLMRAIAICVAALMAMAGIARADGERGVFCRTPDPPSCLFDRETAKTDGGIAFCEGQMQDYEVKMHVSKWCLERTKDLLQHELAGRLQFWKCLKVERDGPKCAGLR